MLKIMQHPGPSDYRKEEDEKSNKGKGFTMRPKTPNGRNCTLTTTEILSRTKSAVKYQALANTDPFSVAMARAAIPAFAPPSWDGLDSGVNPLVSSNNLTVIFPLYSR